MTVDKVFVMILLAMAFSVSTFAAESTPPSQSKGSKLNMQVHGSGKGNSNRTLLDVLKEQKLADYPTANIGQAFDKYKFFSKVVWKESRAANGKTYFDCNAGIKKKIIGLDKSWDNITYREIEVKFVVTPDGDYGVVMVSQINLTKDGKLVKEPITNMKSLLDSIYENKEISF
jgi:hypothetical protein